MEAFEGREPARWVLHSSISTVLGGLGLAAYSGANAVLDAIAAQQGERWLSIDWDAWDNAAEAQTAALPTAIQPAEGQEAFLRLLGAPLGSRCPRRGRRPGRSNQGLGAEAASRPRRAAAVAPRASEPDDAVRRATHRHRADTGRHLGRAARPRLGRCPRSLLRPRRALAAGACRWRRRSAIASRSRCRCCSCSRRRPSPSWRCSSTSARARRLGRSRARRRPSPPSCASEESTTDSVDAARRGSQGDLPRVLRRCHAAARAVRRRLTRRSS